MFLLPLLLCALVMAFFSSRRVSSTMGGLFGNLPAPIIAILVIIGAMLYESYAENIHKDNIETARINTELATFDYLWDRLSEDYVMDPVNHPMEVVQHDTCYDILIKDPKVLKALNRPAPFVVHWWDTQLVAQLDTYESVANPESSRAADFQASNARDKRRITEDPNNQVQPDIMPLVHAFNVFALTLGIVGIVGYGWAQYYRKEDAHIHEAQLSARTQYFADAIGSYNYARMVTDGIPLEGPMRMEYPILHVGDINFSLEGATVEYSAGPPPCAIITQKKGTRFECYRQEEPAPELAEAS